MSRLLPYLVVALASVFASAGFALAAEPLSRDKCNGFLAVMPDNPPRQWVAGFSIVPPAGSEWCGVAGFYLQSADYLLNSPDDESASTRPTKVPWIFARRVAIVSADALPRDVIGLLNFVEQWLLGGAEEVPLLKSKSKLVAKLPTNRGSNVGYFELDRSIGLDCVRYDVVVGTVKKRGVVCLDPLTATDLIQIGADIDREPQPVVERVVSEIDQFALSLWLSPPTDDAEAQLVRIAAERGLALPQFSLGIHYEDQSSYEEALKWYRLAAEQHFGPAEHNLGIFYLQGTGVSRDLDVAEVWLKRAAEDGAAESHFYLASLYADDTGDLADLVQAYVEFSLAVTTLPDGKLRSASRKRLDQVKVLLTPEQAGRGDQIIAQWLGSHARR